MESLTHFCSLWRSHDGRFNLTSDLDIATFRDLMHDLGEFQDFADDDELLGAVAAPTSRAYPI